MKSNYLDWEQMSHFYQKVAEANNTATLHPGDILLYEKRLKEKEEKRKQTQKDLKIANTISIVDAIATINDKTSTLNSQLNMFKEDIEILEGRVTELERNAADRCEIPKRPRRKLTIKVSA